MAIEGEVVKEAIENAHKKSVNILEMLIKLEKSCVLQQFCWSPFSQKIILKSIMLILLKKNWIYFQICRERHI